MLAKKEQLIRVGLYGDGVGDRDDPAFQAVDLIDGPGNIAAGPLDLAGDAGGGEKVLDRV